MNTAQKKILAILLPILVLMLMFGIASKVFDGTPTCTDFLGNMRETDRDDCLGSKFDSGNVGAFAFDKTWWLWLIASAIIGIFEFKLFEDKK